MDPARPGGGRGRGRVRPAQEDEAVPAPAVLPEPVPGPSSAAPIQRVESTMSTMQLSDQGHVASLAERGRCRGRGNVAGRGTRSFGRGIMGQGEQPMQLSREDFMRMAEQFADDPSPPDRSASVSPPLEERQDELMQNESPPPGQLGEAEVEEQRSPPRVEAAAAGVEQQSPPRVEPVLPEQISPDERQEESLYRERGSPQSDIPIEIPNPEDEDLVETVRREGTKSHDKSASGVPPQDPEPVRVTRVGSKGTALGLMSNYLRLTLIEGSKGFVEYHVSFDKLIESRANRRKILRQFEDKIGKINNFDGQMLFLPYILPNDVTILDGVDPNTQESPIRLTVTFVKVKSLHDRSCIQAINILLNRIMRSLQYIELRREFYDPKAIKAYPQHKLQVWPGKDVTASYQEDGLMVCVSTCNRVLSTDTVYDFYKSMKSQPNFKNKFEQFILNKIVLTRYNNKTYRVDEVAWDQTPLDTFPWRGREISYADYLHEAHEKAVKDKQQPMLISKLKPRKNEMLKQTEAQADRLAALIPEFCFVTGLTEDQRKDFKVMTDLATTTRLNPMERMQQLKEFIDQMTGPVAASMLKDWGLQIGTIVDVQARRHDGPDLLFDQVGRVKTFKTGPDFTREATKAIFEPVKILKYVIVCTQRDSDKANRFMEVYNQVAGPLGIVMTGPGNIIPTRGPRVADFEAVLKQSCDPKQVQFVIIIMPGQKDDLYRAIKTHCVATNAVPSQCIVAKTLGNEKRLRSVVLKIALQINAKLGGALWSMVNPVKVDIMFVGIDSAHDPLKKTQSVMCLVATLNNTCTKYFSKSATGATHQELGVEVRSMMEEALRRFRESRGKFPDQVIVFRDGGSEGAISTMRDSEGMQMRVATEICDIEVKLTYVIVNKRINQRFFMQDRRQFVNPHPGSVVDSVVTRIEHYDFYVVSQKVGQGTVNPTHFTVVDPSDPIRPDLIQKLAYVTCFMYYNWSGTVRVPAMVQYAHKLAALLSKSVNGPPADTIANTLYYL